MKGLVAHGSRSHLEGLADCFLKSQGYIVDVLKLIFSESLYPGRAYDNVTIATAQILGTANPCSIDKGKRKDNQTPLLVRKDGRISPRSQWLVASEW